MSQIKYLCLVVSLCLATAAIAWGATPASTVVYVTTGNAEVYAVPTSGAPTPLLPVGKYSGATFNSLAIGPDNTADNPVTSDGSYNFFLYACDNSTNGNIIRLEFNTSSPTSPSNITNVTKAISNPVCGRVGSNVEVTGTTPASTGTAYVTTTTSGNLYVASGSKVYQITDASSTPNGGPFTVNLTSPVTSTSTGDSIVAISQKNSGDLLALDPNGSILLAGFAGDSGVSSPFANTLSPYVSDSNDLTNPVGIARAQAPELGDSQQIINDLFVANNGKGNSDAVYGFDPSTSQPLTPFCSYSSFQGNQNPSSIAASEDNYLYVGVTGNSASQWSVRVLTTGCAVNSTIPLSPLAKLPSGASSTGPTAVAVPPVAAAPSLVSSGIDPSSGAAITNYSFGSSLLQLAPGGCTISNVKQTPMPLSFLQGLANMVPVSTSTSGGPSWLGGAPAPGNGEGGFGTLYSFTPSANCTAANVQSTILISGFFDPTVTNPRIIHCYDGFTSCDLIDPTGNWADFGYLPNDGGTYSGGTKTFGSQYFVVNGNLTTNPTELGSFCGFENPLTDASSPSSPMSVFSSGQGVSVKFKLSVANGGGCSGGNYVTDAYALLSIVQIQDGQGNATFEPIQINTQGSSTDTPPIFKFNSNSQNYQFSLNLSGYNPGIYELTVTFLTNNAPTAITYFQVQ